MSTTLAAPKNVYEAIARVMEAIEFISHDSRVEGSQGGYSYLSEQALISAARPAMLANNLVLLPVGPEAREFADYETARNTQMHRTIIDFRYVWVLTTDPESRHEFVMPGEGADVGDKSQSKSVTMALKYGLRQSLLIATGDDPDRTHSDNHAASTANEGRKPICEGHDPRKMRRRVPSGGKNQGIEVWECSQKTDGQYCNRAIAVTDWEAQQAESPQDAAPGVDAPKGGSDTPHPPPGPGAPPGGESGQAGMTLTTGDPGAETASTRPTPPAPKYAWMTEFNERLKDAGLNVNDVAKAWKIQPTQAAINAALTGEGEMVLDGNGELIVPSVEGLVARASRVKAEA